MNPFRVARSPVALLALAFLLFTPAFAHAESVFDLFSILQEPPDPETRPPSVTFVEGDRKATDEILLINLKTVITDHADEDPSPFDMKKSLLDRIRKDVDAALRRPEIKAVLLEVDTPGGEVTASDIIYHQLLKLREAKKPVLALIGSLGASGGYYVACAADQIWAHPTSIVGSIGVLMTSYNIEKFAAMIGLRQVSLKSERTPKKDFLSPFRELTPEEHAMLVAIINSMHDRFLEIVAKARKKTVQEVTPLADGSIFTSSQALEKGLLDAIGYRDEAIARLKELAKLDKVKLVRRKSRKGIADLIAGFSEAHSGMPAVLNRLESLLEGQGAVRPLFQLSVPAVSAEK